MNQDFERLKQGNFRVTRARPFSLADCVREAVLTNAEDFFKNRFSTKIDEAAWDEIPVDFRTFAISKEHMGFLPLSERQLQVVDFMLGTNPAKTFDNLNQLAVLMYGKGSLLGHQEILTADGYRFTLAECAKRNLPISVWTKTETGKIITTVSTPAIKKAQQENCFRIETSFGHVSEASEDHQYFTVNGWKKLKDLGVGDWICAAQTIPIDAMYNESPDIGKFVGYMLGDGCMHGRFQFFASFSEIIEDFTAVVNRLGGSVHITPGTTPSAKAISITRNANTAWSKGCNPLKEHARRLGIIGKTAKDKRIPVQILFSRAETRKACVEGLFATDGWICGTPGKPRSWDIGYLGKNRALINDLDFLLRGFGVVGVIRSKRVMYQGELRTYWQLLIETSAAQILFCRTFNVPYKWRKQEQLLKDKQPGVVAGSICPPQLSEIAVATLPESLKKLERYRSYSRRLKAGKHFGYETLKAAPWMGAYANSSIMWERIVSISPLGMQDVYTFTVPDTHNYLQGGLLHHNSGKDSLVVLILLYIAYLSLCMRSPASFFGLAEGDSIDCVNVAPSGEKASDVFFDKVKQRILRWHWLHTKYPVKNSGAFTSQFRPDAGGAAVTVTKDGVIFPKGVRLLSRNSDNESAEGLNILVFVMDEASAFVRGMQSNADKLYRALRTSANTRFGQRHKGFIISFPRSQTDDFTLKMYNANLGNLHVCTDRGATWEILPQKFSKSTWTDFHGIRIPVEFKEDFEKDPTGMRTMLMADPPEAEHGFFEFPEKIAACCDVSATPAVTCEDYVKDSRICKRITGFNSSGVSQHDYIITVDLGARQDAAALSLFHKELVGGKYVAIQDFVTEWQPDKAKQLIVSYENMKEFMTQLGSRFHLLGIWFDQWQSFGLQETLTNSGLQAFEYNINYSDYKTLKELVYTQRIKLLPYAKQIHELRKLVDLGTRVDHPRTGCFTGDTEVLTSEGPKKLVDLANGSAAGTTYMVYSYHKRDGVVLRPVEKAWCTRKNAALIRISLISGASILCTPGHRFMRASGRYQEAASLLPGDELMSLSPESARFKLARCVASVMPVAERKDVYDLEVPDTHNFALAAGVFVHNSKDLADTVCLAARILMQPTLTGSTGDNEWGDMESIEANLHTQDPWA